MLTDTATDRQAAVRQIIGADVQVTTQRPDGLPDGFAAAAAALPGVRSGTSVVVDNSASIDTGDGSRLPGVTLVLVDPQAYSALARRVGVGQIDPALLDDTGSPQDAPVAALASPGLAERLGTAGNTLSLPLPYHDMRLRVAGTVDGTLVLPQGGIGTAVLVVSEQALQRQHPDTAALMAHPTNWFGTGDGIDAGKLRALLAELDGSRPGPVVQPVAGVAQAPDAVPPTPSSPPPTTSTGSTTTRCCTRPPGCSGPACWPPAATPCCPCYSPCCGPLRSGPPCWPGCAPWDFAPGRGWR